MQLAGPWQGPELTSSAAPGCPATTPALWFSKPCRHPSPAPSSHKHLPPIARSGKGPPQLSLGPDWHSEKVLEFLLASSAWTGWDRSWFPWPVCYYLAGVMFLMGEGRGSLWYTVFGSDFGGIASHSVSLFLQRRVMNSKMTAGNSMGVMETAAWFARQILEDGGRWFLPHPCIAPHSLVEQTRQRKQALFLFSVEKTILRRW